MATTQTDIDSGVKGLGEVSADSAIRGIAEDLDITASSGIRGISTGKIDSASGVKSLTFTEIGSGALAKGLLGAASAIIGGDDYAGVRAVFTQKIMDDVSAVSSQEDLITVLRILFDYDYGKKTFRKAVQLEAKEAIAKYGRIEKEIQAYWLSSFRTAVQMGGRQLKHYARPKWDISFTTSLDYADIPSGEWIALEEHPLLPVSGRALITNAPLDLSVGEVSFTVEKVVGGPVEVEITSLSEVFEPEVPGDLIITYRDGIATFTILNELGEPLAGASVMLDGTTIRTTDKLGRVQFTTTRGKHRLLVEATGYAPLEFEVTV